MRPPNGARVGQPCASLLGPLQLGAESSTAALIEDIARGITAVRRSSSGRVGGAASSDMYSGQYCLRMVSNSPNSGCLNWSKGCEPPRRHDSIRACRPLSPAPPCAPEFLGRLPVYLTNSLKGHTHSHNGVSTVRGG